MGWSYCQDVRRPTLKIEIFYSELSNRVRKVGRPKKRFKDTLKEHLSACNISNQNWEREACNREAWRGMIATGVETFEGRLRQHQEERRQARHRQRKPTQTTTTT